MPREDITNGQPGCQTEEELETLLYPYYDDPQFYWECQRKDSDAVCRYCPVDTFFQADLRQCVAADSYEWTPKLQPPSSAIDYSGFCTPSDYQPSNDQAQPSDDTTNTMP